MAKLLAIEWDAREARYVLASGRGAKLTIEEAAALEMPSDVEGAAARRAVGDLLREALAGKAARATTIVGVDRSQIELVTLSVPPASDAELPEIVWNEAMRTTSAIGEDFVLDFVPHADAAGAVQQVTAAGMSRARLEQLQAVLSGAGASAKSVTVRPYATAALVLASLAEQVQPSLVINVLADEVDLIVLSGGQTVFWRTLRQTDVSRDASAARRLLAEIQRTRVVAQSHTGGKPIEAAYLCGGLDEHPALVDVLRGELPLELTLVDPFQGLGGQAAPEHPGRYSALVGMLASEAAGRRQAIDFLHPRQRPAPPDRRRTFVLAGAAASVVLLFGGYQVWSKFAAADTEIETLEAQLDELDDQFKRAGQRQKVIAAIDDWSTADVNWLDELRDLSLRFPSGRDAVVERLALSQGRGEGATIDMVGIVRDPVVVSHFENQLRDEHHQISSRHMQQRLEENDYTWHFESSIVVAPRAAGQYLSHLPATAAGESSGARQTKSAPPRSAANKR
jgi:hypothetical protein